MTELCEICGDYPEMCGHEETAKEIAMLRAKVEALTKALQLLAGGDTPWMDASENLATEPWKIMAKYARKVLQEQEVSDD